MEAVPNKIAPPLKQEIDLMRIPPRKQTSRALGICAAFAPWGWGVSRFGWGEHPVFINNAVWNRTWVNRATYVHPYAIQRYSGPRPAEQHELHVPSERERQAARTGRERVEDHRR